MNLNEFAELFQALLSPAFGGENHRFFIPVEVDEYGDIFVAAFGGGLVQTNRLEGFEIQTFDGFGHVMADDSPEPFVGHFDISGDGVNGPLAYKRHDHLLEKKREPTALPGPGYIHSPDTMFWAFDSWNASREVAVMLEKIEMPPRVFLEVVGLASCAACRTRILGSTIRSDLQMKLSRRMLSIKTLAHDPPWRREPQTQGKDFFRKHDNPPGRRAI